jgi:hypothetical protein
MEASLAFDLAETKVVELKLTLRIGLGGHCSVVLAKESDKAVQKPTPANLEPIRASAKANVASVGFMSPITAPSSVAGLSEVADVASSSYVAESKSGAVSSGRNGKARSSRVRYERYDDDDGEVDRGFSQAEQARHNKVWVGGKDEDKSKKHDRDDDDSASSACLLSPDVKKARK